MKNKFFLPAIVFQLGVFVFISVFSVSTKKSAEKNGAILKLECNSYDPVHPLKGHYLDLNLAEGTVQVENLDQKTLEDFPSKSRRWSKRNCYVLFKEGEDGLHRVYGLRKNPPAEDVLFVKAKVLLSKYNELKEMKSVSLEYNFNQYYLQQDYGEFIDSLSFKELQEASQVLEVYLSRKGYALQKDLTAIKDGNRVSIEEFCSGN